MTTAKTIPETSSIPASAVDDDDSTATLRTLSSITRSRIVWTPGLILRRILERERAGLSLNATAVQYDSVNLLGAARRHFGSWDQAVMKARKAAASRTIAHSRETIIARLREHAATGLPMSTSYPLTKSCYKPAVRLFGSWVAAVRAAGLDPLVRKAKATIPTAAKSPHGTCSPVSASTLSVPTPVSLRSRERISWTRDMVVAKIRNRQQLRLSTKYGTVRREAQDLVSAARRLFGSWKAARRAAEMPFSGNRNCSREQILDIMRERWRVGKSVSSCHPDMRPFLGVAQRVFGSWTKMREEAGCARPKPYTKDEVLAALVAASCGDRIPHMRDPDLHPYVPAACRIFGKWSEAVRQAKKQWSEKAPGTPPCGHEGTGERQSQRREGASMPLRP